MDKQPEPHEKRDLDQGGAPPPPAAGNAARDASAPRTTDTPAPGRATLPRQELERLRRKLKTKFH